MQRVRTRAYAAGRMMRVSMIGCGLKESCFSLLAAEYKREKLTITIRLAQPKPVLVEAPESKPEQAGAQQPFDLLPSLD